MADRPILFSAPMVRALLGGRKTQTRRALKPQPAQWEARVIDIREPIFDGEYQQWGQWETIWNRCSAMWEPEEDIFNPLNLRFAVGDRLWVKETWRTHKSWDSDKPSDIIACSRVWYEADARDNCDQHGKVRPSIFMPRWASRITLLVDDVRVERLQDISEADAIAEGIERDGEVGNEPAWKHYPDGSPAGGWLDPRESYRTLWNSINGPGAWEANPWVVAITFRVVRANIDQVPA